MDQGLKVAFVNELAQLAGGDAVGNAAADGTVQHQDLENGGSAPVAGVEAAGAALAPVEDAAGAVGQPQLCLLLGGGGVLGTAVGTDPAHQTLGNDAFQCRRDQEVFHAHVQQTVDGAGGVVGM